MNETAVLAELTPFYVHVIDGKIPHLHHDLSRAVGASGLDRLEIVSNGRTYTGVNHCRHGTVPIKKPLGPRACFLITIQSNGVQVEPLCRRQAEESLTSVRKTSGVASASLQPIRLYSFACFTALIKSPPPFANKIALAPEA